MHTAAVVRFVNENGNAVMSVMCRSENSIRTLCVLYILFIFIFSVTGEENASVTYFRVRCLTVIFKACDLISGHTSPPSL